MKNPLLLKSSRRRVFRGGGWYSSALYVRVSYRDIGVITYGGRNLGFRLFRIME